MLASWLADIAVLAVAFLALGAQPPWPGLLLAYCAGQIASSVPITPGGIGVVETGLTVTLVAFGGCTATTLAAVLLYRLISHWLIIPTGGVAWLLLRLTSSRGLADLLPVAGTGSADAHTGQFPVPGPGRTARDRRPSGSPRRPSAPPAHP
jgi:hypothetical protein